MNERSRMKILALEFSSNLRSVGVAELKDGVAAILGVAEDRDFRGVTGLTLIDRALKTADAKPGDISGIAVGLGPGSYTGIRSAIALAQGWQLGRSIPVVGISSIRCLAEEARRRGTSGEVSIVVDAQREEFYVQDWRVSAVEARELNALKIIPKTAIPRDRLIVGPEASRCGENAMDLHPSASTLAALADLSSAQPAEQLEPIYLREVSFVKAPPPRHIGDSR